MLTGPSGMKRRQLRQPAACVAAEPLLVGDRAPLQRQFDDAMLQPLLRRELALQLLLPRDRRHGVVDAEHLVIARDDLARRARLAVVEQDEVLDEVEQPVMRQHAVEQHLGLDACPCPLSSCRFHSAKCSHSLVIEAASTASMAVVNAAPSLPSFGRFSSTS